MAASATVQLLARHWLIVDGRGNVHEVRGQGVVGEMPLITPGDSYDYVSGCPLDTPRARWTAIISWSMTKGMRLRRSSLDSRC